MSALDILLETMKDEIKFYLNPSLASVIINIYRLNTKSILDDNANDVKLAYESGDEDYVHDELSEVAYKMLELWLPGVNKVIDDLGRSWGIAGDFDLVFENIISNYYESIFSQQ